MSLVHYFDKCFALDSTCCEGSHVKLLVAFSFILTAKMLLPTRQAGGKSSLLVSMPCFVPLHQCDFVSDVSNIGG
ncbi:hypothetical protein AAC387_Pa04g0697 [Persea americana]